MFLKSAILLPEYIGYLIFAKSRHGTHSPFVYDFAENVLYNRIDNAIFYDIELIRQKMLSSSALIQVDDFGASGKKKYKAPLPRLVARSSKNSKYAKLLYRICRYYQPEIAIELGTNFGISALYQAAGLTNGKLFTIEGSRKIAEVAFFNFNKIGFGERIQLLHGVFDKALPALLEQLPRVDYAFIDGNHSKEPTLQYFELLLSKSHNDTIFVFDDIRWSAEMQECWEIIKNHERVKVTIDLFFMGIVFLRQQQDKEHFVLRF
ncbi:MAG: class I SAM-dependent methyltransferase [Bacteroidetes bacterium]|nr:class I SAM-dependent methyltransferase [Bacteroidota bacterium]